MGHICFCAKKTSKFENFGGNFSEHLPENRMASNVVEARRVLVRVKRRRDASPVEALVVKASAKKQKTTDSAEQSVNNAVFTFVGTSSETTTGLEDGRHLVEPHILDRIGSA